MKSPRIKIIGAGLSGLTMAYLLHETGLKSTVLEARNRIGGRIFTERETGKPPVELGATWFGSQHKHLIKLIQKLDVDHSPQHIGEEVFYEMNSMTPPQRVQVPASGNEDTYRLTDGTDSIIHALVNRMKDTVNIETGTVLKRLVKTSSHIDILTSCGRMEADIVISTLPPKLFADTITVEPALPSSFTDIATSTHTWMAESIKVGLRYEYPFWQEKGSSGTIMSNVGPVTEMYDHSAVTDEGYALKGFMAGSYYSLSAEERKEAALQQLKKFFGDRVLHPLSYTEKVWRDEPYTFSAYRQNVIPHQYNGHEIFQKPYLDGKLWFAGAETSEISPGYMDGAVNSAYEVVKKLRMYLKK